ncbi:MAG: response regulator [Pseudomonadota bacterium]
MRILVADDNVDNAETLGLLLRSEGHDVTLAHRGDDAWETYQAATFDVAALDIGMPGMTGIQVAQRIRAHGAAKPPLLIAITGWGTEKDKRDAKRAGFDLHCTKPVDFPQLNQCIRNWPAGRATVSPDMRLT